jgi:Transposase IS116/IS110/IS902 family
LAKQDAACERLMTVPGIGPIISSATVAAIGNGGAFSKGRDFGAWLGLVPKQISTGDGTILGKISKQGNRLVARHETGHRRVAHPLASLGFGGSVPRDTRCTGGYRGTVWRRTYGARGPLISAHFFMVFACSR